MSRSFGCIIADRMQFVLYGDMPVFFVHAPDPIRRFAVSVREFCCDEVGFTSAYVPRPGS
jgi:hypothetical protein